MGASAPRLAGGPWNVVAGNPKSLVDDERMMFSDSRRKTFGGLNIGSVREVNGHRVVVSGFTYGLLPFGAPYTFASVDTARQTWA